MKKHRDKWDLTFLSWTDFKEAVISQAGMTWDILTTANLVIGGVDFTSFFL